MKPGLKIKITHAFAEGLISLIDEYLALEYIEDDDKLIMAGLQEVRSRLYVRIDKMQMKYTLKLTPVQAISLRLFYTDFINEPTSYVGSKLLLISEEAGKKFAA